MRRPSSINEPGIIRVAKKYKLLKQKLGVKT